MMSRSPASYPSETSLPFGSSICLIRITFARDRSVILLKNEKARQKKVINLIASENYVSKDVLTALGSETTNKYAEGYSKERYYGGNEYVDQLEDLTKERALKLFRAPKSKWHVNAQALSGTPANMAVFSALVPYGAKIMGMTLDSGSILC
jgi:glycine hydroxymethyltransferase